MSDESRGSKTQCFVVAAESLLEVDDQTLQDQLAILRELGVVSQKKMIKRVGFIQMIRYQTFGVPN